MLDHVCVLINHLFSSHGIVDDTIHDHVITDDDIDSGCSLIAKQVHDSKVEYDFVAGVSVDGKVIGKKLSKMLNIPFVYIAYVEDDMPVISVDHKILLIDSSNMPGDSMAKVYSHYLHKKVFAMSAVLFFKDTPNPTHTPLMHAWVVDEEIHSIVLS